MQEEVGQEEWLRSRLNFQSVSETSRPETASLCVSRRRHCGKRRTGGNAIKISRTQAAQSNYSGIYCYAAASSIVGRSCGMRPREFSLTGSPAMPIL
jgi:hypothetical protein